MKITVMTTDDKTVTFLDNNLSGALKYFNDEFHRYLETGAATFDLSIAKKHKMYSNAATGLEDDFQYLKENNYLVFRYKDRDYKFKIRRIEETETSLRLFCDNLSLDLLNEYRGPYKADKAYPIEKYVNDCLADSGYTIGINEFAKNERTLEWEGDQTVLQRLLSICNSFGAEIEFETILNDDRTVKENLVHLKKRVGVNRPDIELKYGRNVSSIRRSVDITDVITAIKPRGHEEDGKVTTIKNVEKEVKDEFGNVKFFTKKGSEYLYAPQANQIYGNPKKKSGGYIVGQFSYDTKSDTELFNRAFTELEKKSVPAYEYEIEGYYDVDLGDTIRAIDEGYSPILLLEARVSEQIISFSDSSRNRTVYINYKILENKVNQQLLDRIDEIKKYAEQVAKTYIFSIVNTGSPMFKNGEGEVTFTAKIEKNNQDVTGEFTKFNWIKQNKDGSLDTAWNEAHKGLGKTVTITPADFTDTATFTYEALQEDLSIGGASGIVTNVNDGEDGKTPIKGVDYFDGKDGTNGLSSYLHIRYSQNANGTPMTTDPTGAKYIGMQPSQNPNASTVPADYAWSLIKGNDGIPGETGADGKTSYMHIKYSNDGGKTFTGNAGEDVGAWLGQYVDFTQADSNDVKKYAWSKIKGENGADGKDGVAGKDGVGIKSTIIQYAQNTSGTTAPTSGWQAQVPTLVKGQYLWTKTTWTYTDNSTETGFTVSYNAKDGNNGKDGIAGKDGVGIKDTTITYAKSTSGTTAPTSGWTATIPSVPDGQFLWTKTVWTYTDDSTETGYSAAKMGQKGADGSDGKDGANGSDGVGIATTTVTYQASTSGTSAPTGTWSTTIPSVAANQYLWTKTVITYTNNKSSTAYSVGKMGATGSPGKDGSDGKDGTDGKGIKTTTITYQAATSGTTVPTGTWSSTIPTVADNQYLWTKTLITYTDNSTTQSYAIGKMGAQGPKGEAGQPGANGSDGKGIKSTTITYQASTSGTTVPTGTWVANPPAVAANQYLWTKTLMTFTDNSTTTGYSIGKMGANGTNGKDGADGKPGSNGVSVSSVVEEYYVSTSSTGQSGGTWSTTVPNNADPNKFVWRRMKTTMSDNKITYTNPVLIQGMTGIYPYIGPTQPASPKEGQQWWKSDASGNVTDFFVYKSGSWQGQTIQQSILNIVKLNAVEITGSHVTGTTIDGSTFINNVEYQDQGATIEASNTISGIIDMIWKIKNITQNGYLRILPSGIYAASFDDAAQKKRNWNWEIGTGGFNVGAGGTEINQYQGTGMTPSSIEMYDPQLTPTYGAVHLYYQDLMTLPEVQLTPRTGFVIYGTDDLNKPTAKRQGRVVQLKGAFKNTAQLDRLAGATMGTLPVGYRPASPVNTIVQGSHDSIYLLTVQPNGNIDFGRYRSMTGGFIACGANSWLNVACVYSAADI